MNSHCVTTMYNSRKYLFKTFLCSGIHFSVLSPVNNLSPFADGSEKSYSSGNSILPLESAVSFQLRMRNLTRFIALPGDWIYVKIYICPMSAVIYDVYYNLIADSLTYTSKLAIHPILRYRRATHW